jgi:hypothetical protein
VQDYKMTGVPTNLKVPIKGLDDIQASMPYMEIRLLETRYGHDDSQSAQPAPSSQKYTQIQSSTKMTKEQEPWLERLTFQIDIVGNRYFDILSIAQELRRYLRPEYLLSCSVNGQTHAARASMPHFGPLSIENIGATDNAENFRFSTNLTLFVTTDSDTDSTIAQSISDVVSTYSGSLSGSF